MNRIPKKIWQLGKDPFDKISEELKTMSKTWKIMNPDWDYVYLSNEEQLEWIRENFGEEWYQIVKNYEIRVMQADVIRLMLMYKEGGVYADLDTTCEIPIEEWHDTDYSIYLYPENRIHFVQCLLISEQNNDLIEHALKLIKERSKNIDYSYNEIVHHVTGPGVWTDAILDYLNLSFPEVNLLEKEDVIKAIKTAANKKDIYFEGGYEDLLKFRGTYFLPEEAHRQTYGYPSGSLDHYLVAVNHFYGSVNLEHVYESWQTERNKVRALNICDPFLNYKDYKERKHKYQDILNEGITKLIIRSGKEEWYNLHIDIIELLNQQRKLNPGFDFYYFSDKDCAKFMNDEGKDLLDVYNAFKPTAFKSDVFRYMFLYVNGGCWSDLTQKVLVPHKEIIANYEEVYVRDIMTYHRRYALYNAFMCAAPKSLVILDALRKCKNHVENKFYGDTALAVAGPQVLGAALQERVGDPMGLVPGVHGKRKILWYWKHEEEIFDTEIDKAVIVPRAFGGEKHYAMVYNNRHQERYPALWADGDVYYEKSLKENLEYA